MTYRGRVFQGGHPVAMVEAGTYEEAARSTTHYAHMYFQDGDVDIIIKQGRKIVARESWKHCLDTPPNSP